MSLNTNKRGLFQESCRAASGHVVISRNYDVRSLRTERGFWSLVGYMVI